MGGRAFDSAAWYDLNCHDYIERTRSVDVSHLHDWFLGHLPAGGRILDAGCGSGRDSVVFRQRGYDVMAMDASIEMVMHVRQSCRVPAIHKRHQDVDFRDEFDGIWSMASLLHVPHAELPDVLRRYRNALVPGGVLFASFKLGAGEHMRHGRLFADQDEESFRAVIATVPGLTLIESRIDQARQPGKDEELWLGVLCRSATAGADDGPEAARKAPSTDPAAVRA